MFFFFFFLNCIKEALKATRFKIKFHNEIKPYKSLRIISLIITKLRVMIVTENNCHEGVKFFRIGFSIRILNSSPNFTSLLLKLSLLVLPSLTLSSPTLFYFLFLNNHLTPFPPSSSLSLPELFRSLFTSTHFYPFNILFVHIDVYLPP